jgi:hypothetical protein
MEKKNWGGKREGSGRPRGVSTKIVGYKMELDLYNLLPYYINRNKYINDAVREKMKQDKYI